MTRTELDMKVKSLASVGGVYEILALWVEVGNRDHVEDE